MQVLLRLDFCLLATTARPLQSIKPKSQPMKISLDFNLPVYLGALLLVVTGLSCSNVYNHFPLSYYGLKKLDQTNLKLYLIDNEHVLTNVWSISSLKTNQDEITCRLKQLTPSAAEQVIKIDDYPDALRSQNNILFFAKPNLIAQIANKDTVTFDYNALEKIAVVEQDQATSITKSLKNTLLFIVIAAAVLIPSIYLIDFFSGN